VRREGRTSGGVESELEKNILHDVLETTCHAAKPFVGLDRLAVVGQVQLGDCERREEWSERAECTKKWTHSGVRGALFRRSDGVPMI
jgi:phosphoenolpyruvate synthase/pyruvate phosphate dikinase